MQNKILKTQKHSAQMYQKRQKPKAQHTDEADKQQRQKPSTQANEKTKKQKPNTQSKNKNAKAQHTSNKK